VGIGEGEEDDDEERWWCEEDLSDPVRVEEEDSDWDEDDASECFRPNVSRASPDA
jgi:hypothetical protein